MFDVFSRISTQWTRTILIHFHKHYGGIVVEMQPNEMCVNGKQAKQQTPNETERNNQMENGHHFVYFAFRLKLYSVIINSKIVRGVYGCVRVRLCVCVCVCVCAYDCACRCVCVYILYKLNEIDFSSFHCMELFYLLNAVFANTIYWKSLSEKSVNTRTFFDIFEWICEIAHFCACVCVCQLNRNICNSAKELFRKKIAETSGVKSLWRAFRFVLLCSIFEPLDVDKQLMKNNNKTIK